MIEGSFPRHVGTGRFNLNISSNPTRLKPWGRDGSKSVDPFAFNEVSTGFDCFAVAWAVDEFQNIFGDIIKLMVVRFGKMSANKII